METDFWLYALDEGTGKAGMVSLVTEDSMEILYEIQFADENGNTYPIEDKDCICSEQDTGDAEPGIARSCYKCGFVVLGSQISETKYMKRFRK